MFQEFIFENEDAQGDPVSVEVFRGNTLDFQTLAPQIQKTAERFGVE
jgi:hypothetical protein